MYRNDRETCDAPERKMEKLQKGYPGIDFYQVDTARAPDIRDKHADGGNKPYWKFYKAGKICDYLGYDAQFEKN